MSCFFLILFNGMTINEIYEITPISRIKKSILARAFRGELDANAPAAELLDSTVKEKRQPLSTAALKNFRISLERKSYLNPRDRP